MTAPLTVAFCLERDALDLMAEQIRQHEAHWPVCLVHDLPPDGLELGSLDAADGERRRVVVLSFAQTYQWIEHWRAGSRPIEAWLIIPSGAARRRLTSARPAAEDDRSAIAARLLRYLAEAIPLDRWLDLDDPRFGDPASAAAARRLCGVSGADGPVASVTRLPTSRAARLRGDARGGDRPEQSPELSLSLGSTYRTTKGEAGLSLLEAGWSHAEASHVWSNGQQASIVLPIDLGEATAQCRLTGFHIGRPFRIQALVNGQPVLRRNYDAQGSKTFDVRIPLPIPGRSAGPQPCRIELCFSQTWSPSRLYANSNDRRELAIALSAVSIEALAERDAAMLDIVGGLHAAGLGRLAANVMAPPTPSCGLADIAPSDLVEAGRGSPLIVLIDLPEPGPVLAALHAVLGADPSCVYLVCLGADEQPRPEPVPGDGSVCFADGWDRIVGALRFIERAPDILVVADVGRAIEVCGLLAPALAMSAPVSTMIVTSGDAGEIRRHQKFLSANMETITVHDTCTVLRAHRQVL